MSFLAYVPRFPDKLKAGETIYAWTGPEDGQIWNGFVFVNHSEYLRVKVDCWDGRVFKGSTIPPGTNFWDFKTLGIKMPPYTAIFVVTIQYSVGPPTSESDWLYSESFAVSIGLDGNFVYPLNYRLFFFIVYKVTYVNNVLTCDIEYFKPTPETLAHELYAEKVAPEERTYKSVKIADLTAGRNTYVWKDTIGLTNVRLDVGSIRLIIPKEQFTKEVKPTEQIVEYTVDFLAVYVVTIFLISLATTALALLTE
jgi:hypothetical protein